MTTIVTHEFNYTSIHNIPEINLLLKEFTIDAIKSEMHIIL